MRIIAFKKEHSYQLEPFLSRSFPGEFGKRQQVELFNSYFRPRRDNALFWQLWVLKAQEKVIGIIGLYEEKKGDEVWVGWFCLDEAYRGRGLGRKMLQWTADEARRRDYKVLKLYTSLREPVAQILYEKLGLKIYRRQKGIIYRSMPL